MLNWTACRVQRGAFFCGAGMLKLEVDSIWRLLCSPFLVRTSFLLRGDHTLPKKELHRSLQVDVAFGIQLGSLGSGSVR